MPTLSFKEIITLLQQEDLLKEYVVDGFWRYDRLTAPEKIFSNLTYDSRKVNSETLFFCKGLHFKKEYLMSAVENGLEVYVAETPFESIPATAIIVSDIRKAMAKISQLFYDFPEKKLTLVAITGTKGKTTTNYFIHHILKTAFSGKAAMTSTEETTLDGLTYRPSKLSTPESLDLWEMLAQAVQHNMTHFVMEVSSQAYKLNRVYGLTFDYGLFLNISPDHVGPSEHPNFDDYFYCKRQLLKNCRTLLINHDMDYFPLVLQTAQAFCQQVFVFGSQGGKEEDLTYRPLHLDRDFEISAKNPLFEKSVGTYQIDFPGDFNLSNATAAIGVASLLQIDKEKISQGLKATRVPGRMMVFQKKNGGFIYVDYAHNYTSVTHMAHFLKAAHPGFKLGLLVGATGDRAFSRRKDFGKAISEYFDFAILTSDHPTQVDPAVINADIKKAITKDLPVLEIDDRKEAVLTSCQALKSHEVLLVAGKGTEKTQRTLHGVEAYEGDDVLVAEFIENEQ